MIKEWLEEYKPCWLCAKLLRSQYVKKKSTNRLEDCCLNMGKLTGKTALVTGGSRGIGKAIAIMLAAAGARVIINYERNRSEAEAVAEQIGGIAIQADVADENQVRRLISECGPIDILISNAGINLGKPVNELTTSDFNRTLQVNLTPAFTLTQAVLPGMIEKGYGRIVYISSTAAQNGGVIGPHYAASKAGLIGLMHGYASRLADKGITANAVAPALIETDMIKGNDRIKPDLLPVKRFGQPEEIAQAVLLLVNNAYVTGQTINVNGGQYFSS